MGAVMGKCVFQTKDVIRCAEHALAATNWDMCWETDTTEPGPGLLFVHDRGVYVMSNGKPADMESEQTAYVAFAERCNPNTDNDWWENSRELVGGDDFGEIVPITPEFLSDCIAFRELIIEVNAEELTAYFRGNLVTK